MNSHCASVLSSSPSMLFSFPHIIPLWRTYTYMQLTNETQIFFFHKCIPSMRIFTIAWTTLRTMLLNFSFSQHVCTHLHNQVHIASHIMTYRHDHTHSLVNYPAEGLITVSRWYYKINITSVSVFYNNYICIVISHIQS